MIFSFYVSGIYNGKASNILSDRTTSLVSSGFLFRISCMLPLSTHSLCGLLSCSFLLCSSAGTVCYRGLRGNDDRFHSTRRCLPRCLISCPQGSTTDKRRNVGIATYVLEKVSTRKIPRYPSSFDHRRNVCMYISASRSNGLRFGMARGFLQQENRRRSGVDSREGCFSAAVSNLLLFISYRSPNYFFDLAIISEEYFVAWEFLSEARNLDQVYFLPVFLMYDQRSVSHLNKYIFPFIEMVRICMYYFAVHYALYILSRIIISLPIYTMYLINIFQAYQHWGWSIPCAEYNNYQISIQNGHLFKTNFRYQANENTNYNYITICFSSCKQFRIIPRSTRLTKLSLNFMFQYHSNNIHP